jgi:hypothetical protein
MTLIVIAGVATLLGRETYEQLTGDTSGGGRFVVTIAMIAGVIALVVVSRRHVRAQMRVGYINTLLGLGRCPACGFAMVASADHQAAHHVVCSECGAAWRRERLARVTVPEATVNGVAVMRAHLRSAHTHSYLSRDAKGRRVAPSLSWLLPSGIWTGGERLFFVWMQVAAMIFVAAITIIALVLLFALAISSDALRQSSIAPILSWGVFTFYLPAFLVWPVATAARMLGFRRARACLARSRCPCCDGPLGDGRDRAACPLCHVQWKLPKRARATQT